MNSITSWATLTSRTSGYAFTQCSDTQDDAIFCRLHLRLSEVKAEVARVRQEEPTPFLFLFTDTLVVDASLPSHNVAIVARRLEIPAGGTLAALRPQEGDATTIALLTREVRGALSIGVAGGELWTPPLATAIADGLPVAVGYVTGATEHREVSSSPSRVLGMLRDPMAWNALKASFDAATEMLDGGGMEAAEAVAMLRWTQQCSSLVSRETGPLQEEAFDLCWQSSSLLLLTGTSGGAVQVPKLSQEFYRERVAGLLAVVQSYEQKLDVLDTRSDIDGAVRDTAQALRDIGAREKQAVAVALQNALDESDALRKQYVGLHWEFMAQSRDLEFRKLEFEHALAEKRVWDTVKAIVEVAQAAAAMAAACAAPEAAGATSGAATGAANAVDNSVKQATNAARELADAAKQSTWQKLIDAVKRVKTAQERFLKMAAAGKTLFDALQNVEATSRRQPIAPDIAVPDWAEAATLDPVLEWNIFAEAMETAMASFVKDGVGGAQVYLTSMRTLIEYGKALNNKSVALARVQARAMELKAQSDVAEFAQKRWEDLMAKTEDSLQRKSALKAVLSQRLNGAKRSLFSSARAFQSAYLYRWLVSSNISMTLRMNHQQLVEAFAKVQQGIEMLFTTGQPDQEYFTDSLHVPVLREKDPAGAPSGTWARLGTGPGGKPTLTFNVSLENPPFAGKLPSEGTRGIFVEEAWFYLAGIQPNAQGSVVLKISTSGIYANGYGSLPSGKYHFQCQPMTLDFVYMPKNGAAPEPLVHWRPASSVKAAFMLPTAFTQWTIQISDAGSLEGLTAIDLRFRGTYRTVVSATPRELAYDASA